MRLRTLGLISTVWLLGLVVSPLAGQGERLDGLFELDEEASDDVVAAIEEHTNDMHPVIGRFARRMLLAAHAPSPHMRIRQRDGVVEIRTRGMMTEGVPDGETIGRVRGRDGQRYRVVMTRATGGLVKKLSSRHEERTHTYRILGSGGTLIVEIRAESARRDLPEPLEYRLVYRRVGDRD